MLEWMAWTPLTATFFAVIAMILVIMTLWERRAPTVPRKGFLMITTTRGERLFIALLLTGWINIFWIMATNASQWGALGAGLVVSAIVLAFG